MCLCLHIVKTRTQIFFNMQKHHFFPYQMVGGSGFLAVVDVFSRKRNKLDLSSRGSIRLRVNDFKKLLCLLSETQRSR